MRQVDENFFNEVSYTRDFEPVYLNSCNLIPRTIVHFRVLLPFHLPIFDGGCATVGIDDNILYTYVFSALFQEKDKEARRSERAANPSLFFSEANYTYVEMIYVTSEEMEVTMEELVHCFDRLLDILNVTITAYLVVYKDETAHRITKDMLPPHCVCKVINPNEWEATKAWLLLLHMNIPYQRDLLSAEQLQRLAFFSLVQGNMLNPFTPSEELYLGARRYAKKGFYREAVIEAQSAIETFLSTLYVHLLMYEGMALSDAEAHREGLAYLSMIKREFSSRIGGTWDVTLKTSVVGQYYEKCYVLRNRVAHGGYLPEESEVWAALEAVARLRAYVVRLIRNKKRKYPDLQINFR